MRAFSAWEDSRGSNGVDGLLPFINARTVDATGLKILTRGIKLMLVELWHKKAVLLPTIFLPRSNFQYQHFEHEILDWLISFDPKEQGVGRHRMDTKRLHSHGPRLLLTTDWTRVEDVSLTELAQLHRASLLSNRGDYPHAIACAQFPWSLLATSLVNSFPDRVSFNQRDVLNYTNWIAVALSRKRDIEGIVFSDTPPKRIQIRKKNPKAVAKENTFSTAGQRRSQELNDLAAAAKTHAAMVRFQQLCEQIGMLEKPIALGRLQERSLFVGDPNVFMVEHAVVVEVQNQAATPA